jgi:uncharacterized protein
MVSREAVAPRTSSMGVVLGVFVIWTLIVVGGAKILFPNADSLDDVVKSQVNPIFVVIAALLLGVTFSFKWQRRVGLKAAEPPSSWLVVWPQALAVLVMLGIAVMMGLPPASVLLFVLLNTLIVGFHEELMCRGILFQGLLQSMSFWRAVLLTAFMFGAVHALNGFVTGNFGAALAQAGVAMMSGLWFQAVRLRTRSIYPGMLIHGLWDFAVFTLSQSTVAFAAAAGADPLMMAAVVVPALLPLPLMLYGLWLMRGISRQSKDEVLA